MQQKALSLCCDEQSMKSIWVVIKVKPCVHHEYSDQLFGVLSYKMYQLLVV